MKNAPEQQGTQDKAAWWERFQSLLEDDRDWPSMYTFKFIVPKANLEALQQVFGEHPTTVRASRRGNYMSVTSRIKMASSDDVISIYRAAGEIDGVISL